MAQFAISGSSCGTSLAKCGYGPTPAKYLNTLSFGMILEFRPRESKCQLMGSAGETSMRRMEIDAACAGGAGGPLSKPHTAVKSGARNSAVVPRTTALLRTTVT